MAGEPAGFAGTFGPQLVEAVDAGGMPVAPPNLDGVPPDERDVLGTDVRTNRLGPEDPLPRELIDARGARAGLPEILVREHGFVPVGPEDVELPLRDAPDLDRSRVH
jgi:hypothetical protein